MHNLSSPREIVPLIMELICPQSVVDVGCGIGTFLFAFKEVGVKRVLGIDGSWVNKNLLGKYIDAKEFLEVDLEKPIQLNKKFDLAVCLEVAEHISSSGADRLVENLISLSNIILFSAAIKNQGGQNHLNEQNLTYWKDKFAEHNYTIHDILRPRLWYNENVNYWYKQNIVLFSRKDVRLNNIQKYQSNTILEIVHPGQLEEKAKEYKLLRKDYLEIKYGNKSLIYYLKLILKWFFNKLK